MSLLKGKNVVPERIMWSEGLDVVGELGGWKGWRVLALNQKNPNQDRIFSGIRCFVC